MAIEQLGQFPQKEPTLFYTILANTSILWTTTITMVLDKEVVSIVLDTNETDLYSEIFCLPDGKS